MNRQPSILRLLYPVSTEPFYCRASQDGNRFTFQLGGGEGGDFQDPIGLQIETERTSQGLCRDEWGRTRPFAWAWDGPQLHLWLDGDLFIFLREDVRRRNNTPVAEPQDDILAPVPGAVLEVLVTDGEKVERNQTVLVMESMKMELAITAPRSAIVRRVAVRPGQQVERGMRLLELAPEEPDDD
jgi:acetyl/propionyl-CoA carboxylase alpha subunit